MKKSIIILFVFAVVLVFSVQAQAALETIGTATYGGTDYNLIYDNDDNLTWLDYTNGGASWTSQMSWASGLNTGGVLTYNFNAGVSMNWSDVWRLPTALNQDGSGPCYEYNCTNSEMGHLYYTELGNVGYPSDGYGLSNTGDFQNLRSVFYWSGTEYAADTVRAWFFNINSGGGQYYVSKDHGKYAIAVRPGQLAVVPEPMSMVLFGVGGIVMAARRMQSRRRDR